MGGKDCRGLRVGKRSGERGAQGRKNRDSRKGPGKLTSGGKRGETLGEGNGLVLDDTKE